MPNSLENTAETITVLKERYEELEDRNLFLMALEKAGVEEWIGYNYAWEYYEDIRGEDIIGDINKTSILGVWNSHRAKEMRRKHTEKIFDGVCANCTFNSKVESFVDGPVTEVIKMEEQHALQG